MISNFTQRLNEAFRFFPLTQKELADAVGISKGLMNQYFKGLSTPKDVKRVVAIANIMNINPSWLAGFDEPMKPFKITDEEVELLQSFRLLAPDNQLLVVNTIQALPKQQQTQTLKRA